MATSTVSTLTDDVRRDLECPVCQEQYKDPRMIPCGHTFCLKPCLEQITGDKVNFKCPECRTENDVPSAGLEAFPKNVVISRMLVGPPKTKCKSNISSCPICDEDDELRKCGHCQVYVCYGCLIEHSPQYKQKLQDRAQQILARQEIASNHVKTSAHEISKKIDAAASSAVTLIESKAKELKAAVEAARQEELKHLTEMSEEMESSLNSAVNYSKGIMGELGNKESISPVKLDRINTKLSENELILNEDFKSLVNPKNIDIDLNISGLEAAMEKITVIRSLDHKKNYVETDTPLSPSDDQPGQASAGTGSLLTKDFSQIKKVFDSANPYRVRPSRPRAVAIDPNNGDVAVSDTGNNRIERYDSTGKFILCFGTQGDGSDQFSNPGGLVINDHSQMIICDTGNDRIRIYNKDGSYCRDIGSKGSNVNQFSSPRDLALDVRNNIHVCDKGNGRIQVLTQDGTYLCQYRPAGCTQPDCICITSDDTIYVGDRNQCIILNAYFECISNWKIFEGWFGSVDGMCVYGDNCIISNSYKNEIKIYNFGGECLKSIATKDIAQFRSPRGIFVDKHGDVYVACETVVLKF